VILRGSIKAGHFQPEFAMMQAESSGGYQKLPSIHQGIETLLDRLEESQRETLPDEFNQEAGQSKNATSTENSGLVQADLISLVSRDTVVSGDTWQKKQRVRGYAYVEDVTKHTLVKLFPFVAGLSDDEGNILRTRMRTHLAKLLTMADNTVKLGTKEGFLAVGEIRAHLSLEESSPNGVAFLRLLVVSRWQEDWLKHLNAEEALLYINFLEQTGKKSELQVVVDLWGLVKAEGDKDLVGANILYNFEK
jgi:hypothetical protein